MPLLLAQFIRGPGASPDLVPRNSPPGSRGSGLTARSQQFLAFFPSADSSRNIPSSSSVTRRTRASCARAPSTVSGVNPPGGLLVAGKNRSSTNRSGTRSPRRLAECRQHRPRELDTQAGQLELVALVQATERRDLGRVVLDEQDMVTRLHRLVAVPGNTSVPDMASQPRVPERGRFRLTASSVGDVGVPAAPRGCQAQRPALARRARDRRHA